MTGPAKVVDVDRVTGDAIRFSRDLRALAQEHQIGEALHNAIVRLEESVADFTRQLEAAPGNFLVATSRARPGDIVKSDQFAYGYTIFETGAIQVVSVDYLRSPAFQALRDSHGDGLRTSEDPRRAETQYLVVETFRTTGGGKGSHPTVTARAVRLDENGRPTDDEICFIQSPESPKHIGPVMLLKRESAQPERPAGTADASNGETVDHHSV